jgi:phage antirepressor YoqD-like protein
MKDLVPIEFKHQRLLTTEQLAQVYETTAENIKKNFSNHKDNFQAKKHYFLLQGEELREFKNQVNIIHPVSKHTSSLYLWTLRGANRHCKILDTDKAWEQFDNLEETYFAVKQDKPIILPDSYLIEDPIERAKAWIREQEQMKSLELANKQKDQLIEEQKPKVLFADAVSASSSSILVGELAKLLHQNGMNIGQNRLFEKLRNEGYLIKRKGTDYNMPTQKSRYLALFDIKETTITHSDGHISVSKTTKVTGKGQIYFINKFKEEAV